MLVNPAIDGAIAPARATLRAKAVAAFLIALWGALAWSTLRPASIVGDWMGWRQADTQQIAINRLLPDSAFNTPRINWGGPGPLAVEAEFQGYTESVAALMRWIGPTEAAGQAISLLCLMIAAAALFAWMQERFGDWPALLALASFLCSRAALFLGTSIQPDGMAVASFVLSLWAFDRWLRTPRRGSWTAWIAFAALAAAIKPPCLQLGIVQFVWVALAHRDRLRDSRLWAGWGLILVGVAAQLGYGVLVYRSTGLTFGVVDGDRKIPTIAELLQPSHYLSLVRLSWAWGVQPIGFVAAAGLLLRRARWDLECALVLGYAAAMIVSMRYSSYLWYGTHYHAPGAIVAAVLLARLAWRMPVRFARPLAIVVALVLGLQSIWNVHARLTLCRSGDEFRGYRALARISGALFVPGAPIVVRSQARGTAGEGSIEPNNFQDPRFFYVLRTAGWVIPRESSAAADLERYRSLGARYFVEPGDTESSPEQRRWLEANATRMPDAAAVKLWALAPPSAR